jgi:hypothetical protein
MYTYMYTYVYVCAYVCICVYMCVTDAYIVKLHLHVRFVTKKQGNALFLLVRTVVQEEIGGKKIHTWCVWAVA